MDPRRWQKIEDLFHLAIELPGPSRSKFVENACLESPEIKQEVISLLEQHDANPEFLQRSPATEFVAALNHAVESLTSEISDSINSSMIRCGDENPRKRIDEDELRSLFANIPGQYSFRRLIGRGGMGVVVQVFDQVLERDVALKIITGNDIDDQIRRSIIRESKAVARVKSDHIISIHNVAQNEKTPFLVMELISGPSLRGLMKQHQLDPSIAAEITRQIAVGLQAAHREQLVHRDIKPANVLIEELNGQKPYPFRAKIADFGLARIVGDALESRENVFAGTPAYMSPEQLLAPGRVDERSDIYGLGATLYEMLTGEPPFRGSAHRVIRQIETADPIQPGKLDDRLPRDLESICLKAIHKDPGRRYQTANDMVQDLIRFQEGMPTVARPLSTLERGWRWYRRNIRIAAFGTVAASALLVLAVSSLWFAITVSRKNREIALHQSEARTARLQTLIDAKPAALPLAIAHLALDDNPIGLLQPEFGKPQYDPSQRLNLAMALSQLGKPTSEFIVSRIADAFESPDICENIIDSLAMDSQAIDLIDQQLNLLKENRPDEPAVLAKLAIVRFYLTDFEDLPEIALPKNNPTLRTHIIHNFRTWHGSLQPLLNQLQTDKPANWMICQMIGQINPRSLNPPERKMTLAQLDRLQQHTRYHPVLASALWTLMQWQSNPSPDFPVTAGKADSIQNAAMNDGNWERLTTEGLTDVLLAKIQPCQSLLGRLDASDQFRGYPPHKVRLTHPFAISNSEISVAQYRTFLNDRSCPDSKKPAGFDHWTPDATTSPSDRHPAQLVSWNDAVLFCNWLSEKQGLTPCYRREDSNLTLKLGSGSPTSIENWICDFDECGFRLPTEAEWEIACRAGSTTRFCFGDDSTFLESYGLASNYRSMSSSPLFAKMPNAFGMFDMHGNVWEWCHDWHSYLSDADVVDPTGPPQPVEDVFGRVYRGGGIATLSGDTNSSSRGHAAPDTRYPNLGFRIARTIQPGPALNQETSREN